MAYVGVLEPCLHVAGLAMDFSARSEESQNNRQHLAHHPLRRQHLPNMSTHDGCLLGPVPACGLSRSTDIHATGPEKTKLYYVGAKTAVKFAQQADNRVFVAYRKPLSDIAK
ncbi:hypothetical protein PMIN07_012624 [Paraphaeosphaeria minitans]